MPTLVNSAPMSIVKFEGSYVVVYGRVRNEVDEANVHETFATLGYAINALYNRFTVEDGYSHTYVQPSFGDRTAKFRDVDCPVFSYLVSGEYWVSEESLY